MKIGLFFGSFNPIHTGHLIIAQVVHQLAGLDKIWFVVSPQNPFKKTKGLLHEFDRLDLVRRAIGDNYHFEACDAEFSMPKPSYTADTLAYLSERHPSHHFQLILGSDNLRHFDKWKNYRLILDQYGLLVYPRSKAIEAEPELLSHPQVIFVDAPLIEISATFIRQRLREGYSVRYLVPDEVEQYIRSRRFYE
ncbi:MAG: nicotinate-nucleotide adenylyltransferase [Cytophagales bacterium]|nr:nicotinate-nucleotide adenylyltransferase [Cytophagales bacterium]